MGDLPAENPYAPPLDDSPRWAGGSTHLYRDGDALVVPRENATLPPRCVRCNDPATTFLLRRLYWHSPFLYLLILVGLCVYIIPALIIRKKATVQVGLCDRHSRRRRNGILIGWLGCLGSLILIIALGDAYPALALVCGLGIIVAPIAGVLMAQVVAPKRIDERSVWLRVGRPFLESIPRGTGTN